MTLKVRANTPRYPAANCFRFLNQCRAPLRLPPPVTVAATAPAPATGIAFDQCHDRIGATEPGANATILADCSPARTAAGYKLQGIFYKRNNPSAAINGRTVFVGGRVGDARVTAITRNR